MFAEPLGVRSAPNTGMSGGAPYSALSAPTPHTHQALSPMHMPGSALSARSPGGLSMHGPVAHGSPAHTPMSVRAVGTMATPDTVASVSESLANMSVSMPRHGGGAVPGGMGDDSVAAAAARLASPMAPSVAGACLRGGGIRRGWGD